MNFYDFNLDDRLLDAIESMNYETTTPIQEQAIPVILQGKDLIASAQTGTGKTAAYLLPIVHKILEAAEDEHIQALIIVPTRELAVQISQYIDGLSYYTSVSSIAVYGGSDGSTFSREQKALSHGVDIVICTPGRMIAHLNQGYVKMSGLKYLILDEADRMLDMGFNDDLMKIISFAPKQRQNLLFSATMPPRIRDLARKILQEPHEINIAISKPPEKISQEAFIVYETQKNPLVLHLLKEKKLRSVIVFCSTKESVKKLSRVLKKAGLSIEEIHSDLEQNAREEVLRGFKNRKINILVATDILSRGIDVEDIDLVINFDVPNDGEDYVHRIGRTARAESQGAALTLVSEREQGKLSKIEELLGNPIPKSIVPEQFGEVPTYNPRKSFSGSHSGKFSFNKKKKINS